MSDEEWERWQSTWRTNELPMPLVLGRAKRDRMRAIVGAVLFCGVMAWSFVAVLRDLSTLAAHPTSHVIAGAAIELACCATLTVAFFTAMMGTWAKEDGTPVQLLESLERRNTGKRRLVVMFLFIFPGFAIANALSSGLFVAGVSSSAVIHVVGRIAGALALAAFVFHRLRRRLRRDLAEANVARRLLSES